MIGSALFSGMGIGAAGAIVYANQVHEEIIEELEVVSEHVRAIDRGLCLHLAEEEQDFRQSRNCVNRE